MGGLLQRYLNDLSADSNDLEINVIVTKFTTAVIGKCVFGIECNSLKDKPIWQIADFSESRHSVMLKSFMNAFKNTARAFRMKILSDDVAGAFLRIVREKLIPRVVSHIRRNDFMDLLMELRNMGELNANDVNALTVSEIAAQAFLFFLAGVETSSATISYTLYELAHNTTIQDKARKEVLDVMSSHGGNLTYESMSELIYLDCIINGKLLKSFIVCLFITKLC